MASWRGRRAMWPVILKFRGGPMGENGWREKLLAVHLRSRMMAPMARGLGFDALGQLELDQRPDQIVFRVPGLEVDVAGQIIGKKPQSQLERHAGGWRRTDRHSRSR